MIPQWFAVFFGGGIGALLRLLLAGTVDARLATEFSSGILLVNVLGCFAIGLSDELLPGDPMGGGHPYRDLLMTGVLGGFTTFSTFSLHTLDHLREGRADVATLNVGLSVLLCLLGVWLGHLAGKSLKS